MNTTLRSVYHYGLRPMRRNLVHLTSDINYARKIGMTWLNTGVVLAINALGAFRKGNRFFRANCHVWQTAFLLPRFIHLFQNGYPSFLNPTTDGETDVAEETCP